MAIATITFHKLIQDSQDYGSDDEHMVSRAFFSIDVDGTTYDDICVDIKQTVGSDIKTAPLEVSRPHGYKGPFNHESFRNAAEEYYRGLVGSGGSGIRIQGGSNIRMRNNTFIKSVQVKFEVSQDKAAW